MNRRLFLKITGLTGLGLAYNLVVPEPAVRAFQTGEALQKVFRTELAMGTTVSMTIVHPSKKEAEDAMALAYREIARVSGLMTRFDPESPVSRLNRDGGLTGAPPDLVEVITAALKYYRLTGGAFDITILPVIELFKEKFSKGEKEYPSKKEIDRALDHVGSERIEIKGRDIRFTKPGMGITLDGIAKGYAVDKASKVLLDHGADRHLINAGGDMMGRGLRIDGKPWVVAIQDPFKRKNYVDVILLKDAAVATSGNYENYFDRAKMYHHIANPKTGHSPVINVSASVLAPTAMEADALATSMLVMSPSKGVLLINSLPRCDSLVVTRRDRFIRSAGWKSDTTHTPHM
jgi:thiamine biosynthesis lipoprotein